MTLSDHHASGDDVNGEYTNLLCLLLPAASIHILHILTTQPYLSLDRLQSAAITVFTTLLTCMVGKGQAAIAAMFMNTGRLASIQTSVTSSFTWLVGCLHTNTNHEDHLRSKATQCLSLLAQM